MSVKYRVGGLGKASLVVVSLLIDGSRVLLSIMLTLLIPVVGWFMGWIAAVLLGMLAGLAFMFVNDLVFKIKWQERLLARGLVWVLGSGTPIGTTLATVVTIMLSGHDDRKYNKLELKQHAETASTVNRALRSISE